MGRKTTLFVGADISRKVKIDKKSIPLVGDRINIKNMPDIRDGEYRITKRDSVEYHEILYPRIFAEYVGGVKKCLPTLDFSNTPMLEY